MFQLPTSFTLHGLWPANSTGYSLIRGRSDDILWKHEWRDHGYCSSQTIKDTDYFWAAVLKYGGNTKIAGDAIVNELRGAGIRPSNDKMLRNFIPCPPSPHTRGCGGAAKIIIPTKVRKSFRSCGSQQPIPFRFCEPFSRTCSPLHAGALTPDAQLLQPFFKFQI
nr:uncharacterized protein LOC117275545 [Nicotiana tomentosiformis]